MKPNVIVLIQAVVLGTTLASGIAYACNPIENGCLGCNDDELPACVEELTLKICELSGPVENCDSRRVYDDAERHVLISTGGHMVHINSMMRSARKYQLHHR